MDKDRPYSCSSCFSSFKLTWHLTRHQKTCKGKFKTVTCETCQKKFSCNKSLRVHKNTCTEDVSYKCDDCDEAFVTLKSRDDHRRKYHTDIRCEFCDIKLKHGQNLMRHIRSQHKNLTPAKAKQLERTLSQQIPNKKISFPCDICKKSYFDKSTLNRHVKTHQDLEHGKKDSSVAEEVPKPKKRLSWATNLDEIMIIPATKLILNEITSNCIREMLSCFKHFMAMMLKRAQLWKLKEIKKNYERNCRKAFDDRIFRAILSLDPSSMKSKIINNEVYINIVDINILEEIIEKRLEEASDEAAPYIDLIETLEVETKQYKTAKETIMGHILKTEEKSKDDLENLVENDDQNCSVFERISRKIKVQNKERHKRQLMLDSIDWQGKRMPKLARMIQCIFNSEDRSALKKDFLMEKIVSNGFPSANILSDFDKIIKETKGWLLSFKDFVKRKPDVDINDVCKLFKS